MWYKCDKHFLGHQKGRSSTTQHVSKGVKRNCTWGVDKPLPKVRKLNDHEFSTACTGKRFLRPGTKLAAKFPWLVMRESASELCSGNGMTG